MSNNQGLEGIVARGREEVRDGYRWVKQDCPICGVPPTKYIGRRGGAAHRAGLGVECKVWRCGLCGLTFPNPMPVPVGGVAQHYALDPSDYFRHHDTERKLEGARHILRHAELLTGGRGRLLDVGAGRGEVLVAARELGWKAVGIEPSPSFFEYIERRSGTDRRSGGGPYSGPERRSGAERRAAVDVRREVLECCGFGPESFDVVILAAVLEHLYNPDETVAEIARVLRRGGVLFVDVPNEAGLYFHLGNLYQKLRGRDWVVNIAPTFEPFHVFGFGPRSLRRLLAKHGLDVRDWRVYGGRSLVPGGGSAVGAIERVAAHVVTAASNFGQLGTYIETWAVKVGTGAGGNL
jgi:SAM-dependent methyltransferase